MKTASSKGAKRQERKLRRSIRQKRQMHPAAIVVSPPSRTPWLLSPDEVSILKNAVCKGATDEELKYCLAVARRYELDPFQQQIWFVPRWDKEAERTDGQKGMKVYVPVVGIGGMLHIAARDHADFGTYSEPQYGEMITVEWNDYGKVRKLQVPEWARIQAWKKGSAQPTVAKVWWNEIYPDIDKAPLVRRMPRLMLAKCAKAQATRTSYPKTGGLLIPEETHNREFTDITPGGRIVHLEHPPQAPTQEQIDAHDATNPHLKAFEERVTEQSAGVVPCLFYKYFPQSETYEITGAQSLLTANRDLFKPLFSKVANGIVATGEQLGKLLAELERRKVLIRALEG